MTQEEKIARGKRVFDSARSDNPCRLSAAVVKIVYHEYFTSSHDDTAVTISLIGPKGETLWQTKIADDFEEDAWALKAYLRERFQCPVETIEL